MDASSFISQNKAMEVTRRSRHHYIEQVVSFLLSKVAGIQAINNIMVAKQCHIHSAVYIERAAGFKKKRSRVI